MLIACSLAMMIVKERLNGDKELKSWLRIEESRDMYNGKCKSLFESSSAEWKRSLHQLEAKFHFF